MCANSMSKHYCKIHLTRRSIAAVSKYLGKLSLQFGDLCGDGWSDTEGFIYPLEQGLISIDLMSLPQINSIIPALVMKLIHQLLINLVAAVGFKAESRIQDFFWLISKISDTFIIFFIFLILFEIEPSRVYTYILCIFSIQEAKCEFYSGEFFLYFCD